MDLGGEENSVESPLLLKSTQFHLGEHVLAHFSNGLHEAKVLQVDSRAKRFFVHYHGLNKKWDAWVGIERLMKLNKQNHKAPEKEYPLKYIPELKIKDFNVNSVKKRKTTTKGGGIERWAENKFVTSVGGGVRVPVVRNPGVKVGLNSQATLHHVATPRPQVDNKLLGPTLLPPLKPGPKLWEPPRVSNAGAPVADLSDPSDLMKARLLVMSETEFSKNYDCMSVNNLVYMVEMKKRYDALKAKEVELKEELMRCKATIASQAKNIGVVSQGANRMRKELDEAHGKVKEMQVERADVIKGATRAEAARAHAEAETAALGFGQAGWNYLEG